MACLRIPLEPDAEDLLREWTRLGKSKDQDGLAVHPWLLRLRDATEAYLATHTERR